MSSRIKTILVVEDEPDIARLISLHVGDLGHETIRAATCAEARRQIRERDFDLVILDLMLPDGDGLEVCRQLRARKDYTPILMLTARSTEIDRVVGLEVGSDDYLTKPFSVRELAARVKALLRRVDIMARVESTSEPRLQRGELIIDTDKRQVTVAGEPVRLTAREFDLLLQLASHPGRVYTRSQLLDLVWGYGAGHYEHTVNSHINRLRGKLERDPSQPRYIQTVWGVGYRFSDSSEPED